jgi:carotene epsilon-monooxygenase
LLAIVKARAMREVAEADRVDWANLKPAKDIGEEWMEKALFNSEATGAVSAGKCPMGH